MIKEGKLSRKEREEVRKEVNKEIEKRFLKKATSFTDEFKKQFATSITTAFGLVAALTWKDTITMFISSFDTRYLPADYPIIAQIYSAILITLLATLGILAVSKWAKGKEKEEKREMKNN